MQGGGAARQGHGVGHADAAGQLVLEHVDVGPEGRDPTRVERLEQQLSLLVADVGWREVDAGHAGASGSGRQRPARGGRSPPPRLR